MAGEKSGQEQLDALDDAHFDDGEEVVMDGGSVDESVGEGGGQSDTGDIEVVIDDSEPAGDGGDAEAGDTDAGGGDPDAQLEGQEREDDDDDDTSYSAKVRKRIQRERRLREEVEAERDQERLARAELEQKLRASAKFNVTLALSNLDFQINAAQAELKNAKEAGDTDAEIKAQTKLTDLQAKKREAETVKARLESEEEKAKQGGGPSSAGRQAQQRNPFTERWLRRNRWFRDERFAVMAATVRAIDAKMASEGYRPDNEAYFIELDKRIHRELPHLRARLRQAGYAPRAEQQGQRRPQGGALPVRTAATHRPAGGGGKVVLTRTDLENMERFGLDPSNKQHQIEYARQKMRG